MILPIDFIVSSSTQFVITFYQYRHVDVLINHLVFSLLVGKQICGAQKLKLFLSYPRRHQV